MNEKERHEKAARKASEESANLQKKIAEKRNKRNDAYLKLQRELQNERKKEISTQQRVISNMQRSYEERIAKLENQARPILHTVTQQANMLPEYDVFISHASEDKEDFVDEFVAELRKAGVKVWYDTTQILWGDSLRKRIDEGLRKSRFGIAVLSPNYIADGKYWTKEELERMKRDVNCHDVCNMQYTSGTTGFPKGVMLTHYGISNDGYFTGENMGFTQDDKLCVCVPLFHCFGVVLATMNCLTHGCTEVMVEKFDPLVVLASIHKERCTAVYGVPTMFIAELNHPMFDMFDLTCLRTGIMAGSLCPVELMKQVSEKMYMTITSVYGLTESSPGMTQTCLNDTFEQRCTTVGRDYPFVDVKVLNPETGEECPVGVQGEMCCKGFNVMKGYYKNPEATAEVIDKNGYLHSGDLGIKDEEGFYKITGRIKDMIIRGGENIYPREIEEFLYHMPGIRDVQVAAVPSKKYGEAVGAFIILEEGVTMTPEDVQLFCRGKIARYKIPKYVFFIDQFPLTGSGKIQKFKLKEMSLDLCAKLGIVVE